MNKSTIKRIVSFGLFGFALIVGGGSAANAQGGRDPFLKNPILNKKNTPARPATQSPPQNANVGTPNANSNPNPNNSGSPVAVVKTEPKKTGPYVVEAPSTEARISYFKQVRESAAMNGAEIPKVTTVMLLDELVVTGIFKTKRGYAAMVKAEPIDLSFSVYPGEKFFDGQLVAVEENRVIFKKVTKWSNGKFVSSVDTKPLRTYTDQQTIQGTAPPEAYTSTPKSAKKPEAVVNTPVVSPFEEMKNQPTEKTEESAKNKKGGPRKSSSSKGNKN